MKIDVGGGLWHNATFRFPKTLAMPPPSNLSRRARIGARFRRRGFTLIEIALAMAVIGLLLGATAMSSRMLEERRQIKREMERLQRVSDAVVGYALRNRTRERVIKFVVRESPHLEWAFRLPAGRPYLPCPDWDGDGYEDRWPGGANGFTQGVEIKPDLTVRATISEGNFPNPDDRQLTWFVINRFGGWQAWRPYGDCWSVKGAVPWRTLGVEPSDGWGNRHTYFADPVFSSAIFGFDRQTVADIYDSRVPFAQGVNRSQRLQIGGCPATVCNGGHTKGNACARHGESGAAFQTGECAWRELDGLILKAGAMAEEDIIPALRSSGSKSFAEGAITDGLPFVLVSHGPNGRFAVNHWATLEDPFDNLGFRRPVCNYPAWAENVNLGVLPISPHAVSEEERGLLHEAVNGNRPSSGVGCPRLLGEGADRRFSLGYSFFVWQPPAIGDKSDFDDLLLWKTRGELTAAIHGRIPRLPHMAIPYFPE